MKLIKAKNNDGSDHIVEFTHSDLTKLSVLKPNTSNDLSNGRHAYRDSGKQFTVSYADGRKAYFESDDPTFFDADLV